MAHADNDVSKVNGAIRIEAGQTVGEVSSVNGSVRLEEGVTAGDVDTVNGSIHVGARSSVGVVDTVNGGVTLEESVKAKALESVNGSLRVGASSEVDGDASCVNCAITLSRQSSVRGHVETVNGSISLEEARVGGGLETVNGNIDVGARSHVSGGIVVKKNRNFGFFNSNKRKPKITIGPGAVVEGTLTFEREVELYVSDTAKIGKVEGATPIKFSGERP
jgi:DUF4097 and DUF4098 domain-containing protein YvlB